MIGRELTGNGVLLVPMGPEHVTERYLSWMSDPLVTQYLESRFDAPTLEGLAAFVQAAATAPDSYMFAILLRESGEHVGNIKLGEISRHHLRGSIGIIIGEPSAWGRGVATEVVELLSRWAFDELGLVRLSAGAYAANVGSIRAFEKAGFVVEGTLTGNVVLADGTRGDGVMLGRVAG